MRQKTKPVEQRLRRTPSVWELDGIAALAEACEPITWENLEDKGLMDLFRCLPTRSELVAIRERERRGPTS